MAELRRKATSLVHNLKVPPSSVVKPLRADDFTPLDWLAHTSDQGIPQIERLYATLSFASPVTLDCDTQ